MLGIQDYRPVSVIENSQIPLFEAVRLPVAALRRLHRIFGET